MGQSKEPTGYEKQLIALARTLQALREGDSLEVLIEKTLSYLSEEFSYTLVWLALYDRVDHCLIGKGGLAPVRDLSFLKQKAHLAAGDLLEQVVIQQRLVGVPDLRSETRAGDWRRIAQKLGVQGTLIFPIRYRDYCSGVALLGSSLWGTSPRADEKIRLSILLGELGAALHQYETTNQRLRTKRPEEPLMVLLNKLRALPNLKQRLEAVVEKTQEFVIPSRTSIYWFEREQRYFWRRLVNRAKAGAGGDGGGQVPTITAQEFTAFYQSLANDQLVMIGESQSSLKADVTGRLMSHIRTRSLLAAPILFQNELMGFLAVEGNEARIWQEEEKTYLRGAAQLIALTAPLEEMEERVEQTRLDQSLTAEINQAICSEEDWNNALKICAERLCKRLKAERFLVILYDRDFRQFNICYQSYTGNRRALAAVLKPLNDVDLQMLERSQEAIGIENLETDLRLLTWRDALLEVGTKSLVICNTALGSMLEGVLVICHDAPRSWSQSEREVVRIVSQQVGMLLHQWQLQRQTMQQHQLQQTVQRSLSALQQSLQREHLENVALQHLSQILQVPLAALITWSPGRSTGYLAASVSTTDQFKLKPDLKVPLSTDPLIQWTLQSEGLLQLTAFDLTAETRQWLSPPGVGQIITLPLRTSPNYEPTGIVLLADHSERLWTERHLNVIVLLVSQLSWFRRYLRLTEKLNSERSHLGTLAWYKQRRLEDIYRALGMALKRLNDQASQKEAIPGAQYQQILRQLADTLNSMNQLIKDEQLELKTYQETAPLSGLLKRALDRVDSLIKQRQLWSQVHNNEGNLILSGDITKIELVLHEILVTACHRCQPGGRVDIWCRYIDQNWLELSITDSGIIEPLLIEELQSGRVPDLLAPSTLDQSPGLNLMICQHLMQQMNGEFSIYKLDDNRVLSRLILPLSTPFTRGTTTTVRTGTQRQG